MSVSCLLKCKLLDERWEGKRKTFTERAEHFETWKRDSILLVGYDIIKFNVKNSGSCDRKENRDEYFKC